MRPLTFVVGTGRSGSSALSRILSLHPEILSLNELLASLDFRALPEESVCGVEFWRILADPNPVFDKMIRSGVPLPEFLYPRRPGRFSAETTGIPALCMMVLPHLTDDPDGLLDELAPQIAAWPRRPAPQQHEAFFDLLCTKYDRNVVVERSGHSLHWIPRLSTAFPYARFVHLFRDGPDCAVSMSRHVGYRTISLLREILEQAGVESLTDLTPEHVRDLPPDLAALLGDRFDSRLVLDRPMPLTSFGHLWSQLITEGMTYLEQVPAQMRTTLAYEDLVAEPDGELSRLADFIGVAALPDWLEAGRTMLDGGKRGASLRLPPDELSALRERCAPGMSVLHGA